MMDCSYPRIKDKRKILWWTCLITFSILLLGGLCYVIVLTVNANEVFRHLWSGNSTSNYQSNYSPDNNSCRRIPSAGFLSNLFLLGYDPSLIYPLRKRFQDSLNLHDRLVLQDSLLEECQLTAITSEDKSISSHQPSYCFQPQVQSRLIESYSDFKKWVGERAVLITDDDGSIDPPAHRFTPADLDDPELLSIRADLLMGHKVIVTSITIPKLNVSHAVTPDVPGSYPATNLKLAPNFLQQLAELTPEDEAIIKLVDHFGTHFVQSAVFGHQALLRFTLKVTAYERGLYEYLRTNVTVEEQATAAALYVMSHTVCNNRMMDNDLTQSSSLTNPSPRLIINVNQTLMMPEKVIIATTFLKMATINFLTSGQSNTTQLVFGGRSSVIGDDTEIGSMMLLHLEPATSVIKFRLKRLDSLFNQSKERSNTNHLKKWRHAHQSWTCSRLRSCQSTIASATAAGAEFALPLLSLSTAEDGDAIHLQLSYDSCLDACRRDAQCTAVTTCRTSPSGMRDCPKEFGHHSNCTLHRRHEFNGLNENFISIKVASVVLVRHKLKPVAIKGFSIYGDSIHSTNQPIDVISCIRLCSKIRRCQIASFSAKTVYSHRLCRLFYSMTGNELRLQEHSTVVFMTEEPGPHSEEEANNNKHNNCPENHDCFQCSGTDASRCVIKGGKSIRVSDGSTSDAARPDTSTSRHHQQPTNQSIGHRSTAEFTSRDGHFGPRPADWTSTTPSLATSRRGRPSTNTGIEIKGVYHIAPEYPARENNNTKFITGNASKIDGDSSLLSSHHRRKGAEKGLATSTSRSVITHNGPWWRKPAVKKERNRC